MAESLASTRASWSSARSRAVSKPSAIASAAAVNDRARAAAGTSRVGRSAFMEALRSVGKEELLQVVQESLSQRSRTQHRRIPFEEAASLRLFEAAPDERERIAGALCKQRGGNAFGQAQRVQHELETDVL